MIQGKWYEEGMKCNEIEEGIGSIKTARMGKLVTANLSWNCSSITGNLALKGVILARFVWQGGELKGSYSIIFEQFVSL